LQFFAEDFQNENIDENMIFSIQRFFRKRLALFAILLSGLGHGGCFCHVIKAQETTLYIDIDWCSSKKGLSRRFSTKRHFSRKFL